MVSCVETCRGSGASVSPRSHTRSDNAPRRAMCVCTRHLQFLRGIIGDDEGEEEEEEFGEDDEEEEDEEGEEGDEEGDDDDAAE